MLRWTFNGHVVRRCIDLLKSKNDHEIYESVIHAAYLIEQSFKEELRQINPLLYFETSNLSPERLAQLAKGTIPMEELLKLKTISAQKLIQLMCEIHPDLKSKQEKFLELCHLRNIILHSTDSFPVIETAAEAAASAIDAARTYIISCSDLAEEDVNPLSSREFDELQRQKVLDRLELLKTKLEYYKAEYNKLSQEEKKGRSVKNKPKENEQSWIEATRECPACKEDMFDEIVTVDFDISDGLVTGDAGSTWVCRICELELSKYEMNLIGEPTN